MFNWLLKLSRIIYLIEKSTQKSFEVINEYLLDYAGNKPLNGNRQLVTTEITKYVFIRSKFEKTIQEGNSVVSLLGLIINHSMIRTTHD